MKDIETLAVCPCGKTPTKLIIQEGNTYRWRQISGDCCGEWEIESSRIEYQAKEDDVYKQCVEDWNEASRATALQGDAGEPDAWMVTTEFISDLVFNKAEAEHNYRNATITALYTSPPNTSAKLIGIDWSEDYIHEMQARLDKAIEALKRIASNEAFDFSRALDKDKDSELIARMNHASEALKELE